VNSSIIPAVDHDERAACIRSRICFRLRTMNRKIASRVRTSLARRRGVRAYQRGLMTRGLSGFHFTGVTTSGVLLIELTQPNAVSLQGFGSL
jgi:hypothetical protein